MAVCTSEGDTKDVRVPDALKNKPCLTDEQINILFNYAVALEKHYGNPQDIEWAMDQDNQIYILQSRPLRMLKVESSTLSVPRRIEKYNILIDRGVIACKGIGYGKAFILKDHDGLEHFPEGAVLVARHTSPKFVTVMNKAAAIITDVGSATGHMASLSREYQVPTILDTETATRIIKDGQELTVDAVNCNVYEGKVEELINLAFNIHRSTFKDTHLFQTLERVLKLIVPLNLIDPDKDNFRPEQCETFHDITRFTHEMAMAEIFRTREGEHIETLEDLLSLVAFAETDNAKRLGEQTIILRAGIPVDARLLNIDGGVRKKDLRKATPEDITSIPFSAFLKGMINMKWPEPRPVDAKGFFGMVANTAATQEEELLKMGGRSYAIISLNYMNFSIRLGYHFSLVEAYAGDNLNDNYIKFFFKGGGAATDRRLRRVRLITEIIKKLDFRVKVTGDVINAILTKYNLSAIEERLGIMGKLTAYTKQLDMVMYNDAVTDMFIEDFVRDHVKLR
jgi:pyruvate,water dikinase